MSPLDLSKLSSVQARTGSMPTTGRWGWYRDHEGREYRRVSTLVKKVETDTYNLEKWKLRQVGEGLAIRDDLVFALKAMGRPDPVTGWSKEQKKEIDRICDVAMEVAKTGKGDGAKVGTAFHTLTERVDRGEPIEQVAAGLAAGAAETIRAYAFMREENAWRTVEIERTVVLDDLEVAGTLDRVDFVPGLAQLLGPGTCQYDTPERPCDDAGLHGGDLPVIVDVKTEEQPWLNGLHIGPQLAIYSRARKMWRPTGGTHSVTTADGSSTYEVSNGEYVPAPCVRQDVAVVVHLRDGKSVPYFVNLAEGWEAAQAAYAQMNREARAKRKIGGAGSWFAPVPGVVEPKPAQMLVQTAVAANYADPARPAAGQVGEVVSVGGIDFTRKVAANGDVTVSVPLTEGAPTPDGWRTYTAGGAETVGGHGSMPPVNTEAPDPRSDLARLLIEAIWKAVTLDGLAILWNMARDRDVPWTGPVEQAADARRRQIECPQRAMSHVPGTVKCACGWVPAVAP